MLLMMPNTQEVNKGLIVALQSIVSFSSFPQSSVFDSLPKAERIYAMVIAMYVGV